MVSRQIARIGGLSTFLCHQLPRHVPLRNSFSSPITNFGRQKISSTRPPSFHRSTPYAQYRLSCNKANRPKLYADSTTIGIFHPDSYSPPQWHYIPRTTFPEATSTQHISINFLDLFRWLRGGLKPASTQRSPPPRSHTTQAEIVSSQHRSETQQRLLLTPSSLQGSRTTNTSNSS